MAQPELELAAQIRTLFPGATPRGRASWSVAFQNGRSHMSRVSLEGETVVLTIGPLDIHGSPQGVAAMNASLPAASRIVLAANGLQFRTESSAWEAAVHDFQTGLDILGGAPIPAPATLPAGACETQEPSPHWNARAEGDGVWRVPIPHEQATAKASASSVTVDMIAPSEYPDEVRAAVAELLLRGTSHIRFVKACAAPDSAGQWTAWLQAGAAACGMDEALTSVALAYRECAPAVRALSEVRLALRFREVSSAWPPDRRSISKEGR